MMNNLFKNICLVIFALIGPITLPAGGIQKSLNQYRVPKNTKEIVLVSEALLYSFPEKDSSKLMVLDSGTSITILRNWKINEREIWLRVKLASNKILDDPNKVTRGWIKI